MDNFNPLAILIISGLGAIVTVILFFYQHSNHKQSVLQLSTGAKTFMKMWMDADAREKVLAAEVTKLQGELKDLKAVATHMKQAPALSTNGVQLTVPTYLVAMDFAQHILLKELKDEHYMGADKHVLNLWTTYFEQCVERASRINRKTVSHDQVDEVPFG
jgi:hypothetical protein